MNPKPKEGWTWASRTYDTDDEVDRQVQQGKHCLNCVHCNQQTELAYIAVDKRYYHLCTVNEAGDIHFVWDGYSCRAFTWLDGKAPRAPSGKRRFNL